MREPRPRHRPRRVATASDRQPPRTARALNNALQAHSAQNRARARGRYHGRPNWRFGRTRAGEEHPSSPARVLPKRQFGRRWYHPVTAGPRQLGTKAAGQAGSPRRAALVEPHAASTSLLSQRPAHPTHRPGRARPRGPSRRRPAAVGVRNGCPDLPAGCLRAACHCSAACCWSSVCQPCLLGPCCSGCIPVRALVSPAALGGVWWCWGCRAWHWAGAETYFVVKI